MEIIKPNSFYLGRLPENLKTLVEYYYSLKGNKKGGNLGLILEDLNVTDAYISFGALTFDQKNDTLGRLICEILSRISFQERERLAQNGWNPKL